MIIDARNRPATRAYLDSTVLLSEGTKTMYKAFGVGVAPSVTEESMDLYWKERDETRIDLACAPARWGAGPEPIVPPEEVVRVMKEYPKRFSGAIAICGAYLEKSIQMIEKFVVNGPVPAVCLEPGISPVPMHFDDARLYPLYDYLQTKEIPLFLMAGGVTGPTIDYNSPERLDKMLADFPRLTVINIHGGVPYVDGMIFCAFRRPNMFLCPDMYLNNTCFCERYVQAANCMLSNQFIFGTSYPFMPMKEGYDLFMEMGVKPEFLDNVLYKNIAMALKINPDEYRHY